MKFYPLKFKPIPKQTIWGGNNLAKDFNKPFTQKNIGESWEISCIKNNVSAIENGELSGQKFDEVLAKYGKEILGKKVYEANNGKFPLLFKLIDANKDLSIQVHPNDDKAKQFDSFGKTEMWYVLEAQKDSCLLSGFKEKITSSDYADMVAQSKITDVLSKHSVKGGDCFYIPAGRVHAIGSGIVLAEIQQSSDITYRIFDYNRTDEKGNKRELHTDLAKEAIDYSVYSNYKTDYTVRTNDFVMIADCPYFNVRIGYIMDSLTRKLKSHESFVVYMCVDGSAHIKCGHHHVDLKKGESALVPAEISDNIEIDASGAKLLEVMA
jgi:mannose-6-phosphate isomerase